MKIKTSGLLASLILTIPLLSIAQTQEQKTNMKNNLAACYGVMTMGIKTVEDGKVAGSGEAIETLKITAEFFRNTYN
jgi:hypothetical protein